MNIKALSLCCLLGIGMVAPSMDAMQANASRWSHVKKWAAIGAGAAGIGGVVWWLWRGRGPTSVAPEAGLAMAEASRASQSLATEAEPVPQKLTHKVIRLLLKELKHQKSLDKFVDVNAAWLFCNPNTGEYRMVLLFETFDCDENGNDGVLVKYTYKVAGFERPSFRECAIFSHSIPKKYVKGEHRGWSVINFDRYLDHSTFSGSWIMQDGFTQLVKKFVAPAGGTVRINIDPHAVAEYVAHPDVA